MCETIVTKIFFHGPCRKNQQITEWTSATESYAKVSFKAQNNILYHVPFYIKNVDVNRGLEWEYSFMDWEADSRINVLN